jgi:outer membrane protein, multidrug efflux system
MMRPMRRTPLLALPLFLLFSTLANAQPTPPAKPDRPVGPPPAGELPPTINVDDPMLQPIARAKTEIATWEDALKHVRARSTDLRIAAAEVARAEGLSRVALAGVLTTINGTATYTHNIITNTTSQVATVNPLTFRNIETPFPDFVTANVSAIQPVIAPRQWYAIGTTGRAEDAARLSLEDAKRLIALSVANAIVAVVTAERVAELNRLGLRNALTRLELTTRKTALGGGTGLDVIRARQDVETSRATLVAGDETLRQARESLGLALGLPEQVGVPVNVDINGLEASARATCRPAPNIDERPDVAALRTNAEVAHRNVNDVKYQFSPIVDVRSNVFTTTVDTGAAPNTTWNVQAVLTVPIWDGGARYGNLHATQALENSAQQKLEAQRRKATIEVAQAQRGVSVADDRRKVAAQTRDLAAENDRLTRAAYLEGRGTSLELVTAAQALREAEIQLALRDFELVRARVLAVLVLASCPW